MDKEAKLLKEAYEKIPKPAVLNETAYDLEILHRIAELEEALAELRQNTVRSIDNLNDRVDRLQT